MTVLPPLSLSGSLLCLDAKQDSVDLFSNKQFTLASLVCSETMATAGSEMKLCKRSGLAGGGGILGREEAYRPVHGDLAQWPTSPAWASGATFHGIQSLRDPRGQLAILTDAAGLKGIFPLPPSLAAQSEFQAFLKNINRHLCFQPEFAHSLAPRIPPGSNSQRPGPNTAGGSPFPVNVQLGRLRWLSL